VESPKVIHISNYRRRRRQKVGGPVFNLEAGIVQKRSYTNVLSVVSFIIYAGLMVYVHADHLARNFGKLGKERDRNDDNAVPENLQKLGTFTQEVTENGVF